MRYDFKTTLQEVSNGVLLNDNNMQLHIEITTQTLQDFNDVNYDVKYAKAVMDGTNIQVGGTYETTLADADIKTSVKSKLTSIGYTWDSEV